MKCPTPHLLFRKDDAVAWLKQPGNVTLEDKAYEYRVTAREMNLFCAWLKKGGEIPSARAVEIEGPKRNARLLPIGTGCMKKALEILGARIETRRSYCGRRTYYWLDGRRVSFYDVIDAAEDVLRQKLAKEVAHV